MLYITIKSGNSEIEYVRVNGIDAEKQSDTKYRMFVSEGSVQATVDIKAKSSLATITVNVSGVDTTANPLSYTQQLPTETTTVNFIVTTEAGEEKNCTLDIIKESSDNTLNKVYVNGVEVFKDTVTGRYGI